MIFVESGRLMNLLAFENTKGNGFLLYSAHLFVPLTLTVQGTCVRKYKRKRISFVFCSLIRTFGPTNLRYSRSEKQKNFWISFAFHSLIRTFAGEKPRGTCSTPFNKTRI